MGTVSEHEYTTYPRKFVTYKWFKPILAALLFVVIYLAMMLVVDLITKFVFGVSVSSSGYDDMDFFSAAGAWDNGAKAAAYVPALILTTLIIKDRPVSSLFSSMGGWRWKPFLKTLAAAFVILGIPTILWYVMHGRVGDVKWTVGGFVLLTIFVFLQGIGEEMVYRGFITQTISSWFMVPAAGIIVQIILFVLAHNYNLIGRVEIGVSALLYTLVCVISRGLESGSALHIINNITEIYMAGFGFTFITAEQNVPNIAFNLALKILFVAFIWYAEKKLHWFDEVKKDDVAQWNAEKSK